MVLFACKENSKPTHYIDLAGYIDEGTKNVTLNEWIKGYKIIPVDNHNILLNQHKIRKVTKDYVVLHNTASIYFLNRNTGAVEHVINCQGRGAGEYLAIGDYELDENNRSAYIVDLERGNMLQYTYDGELIREIDSIKNISDFKINRDGSFWICYNPHAETGYMLGKYDTAFVLQQQYIPEVKSPQSTNLFFYNEMKEFNDRLYFQPENCDTIYHISTTPSQGELIVHKGKLKMPLDIKSDIRKKAERKNYIWDEYNLWAKDLYFITYYYNDQKYQDIWNTDRSDLLFRNIMTGPADKSGIELKMDEGSVRIWPCYASEGYLYAIVEGIMAHRIFPEYAEDSNGFILEMEMK